MFCTPNSYLNNIFVIGSYYLVSPHLFSMAPNSCSTTPQQITVLLDEHKDHARGRLRSIEGKVQTKRLWEELCDTLNSMGGCTKTIQQWQKVPNYTYILTIHTKTTCAALCDPHTFKLRRQLKLQESYCVSLKNIISIPCNVCRYTILELI